MWRFSILLAGCYTSVPPPFMAPHTDAAAQAVGTTTGMLIFGGATDFAGTASGFAVRFEHQQTDRDTLGLDLTTARIARGSVGGKGSGGAVEPTRWLFAIRGYGRYSVSDHFATSAGLGVSVLETGLVTGTIDSGILVSRPSGDYIPVGSFDLSLALPLHNVRFAPEGSTWGQWAEPMLSLALDYDSIAPIGNTGNRFSLDLGVIEGFPLTDDGEGDYIVHASIADTQRL